MKLCLFKVTKLDACIRPLFANSVTYGVMEDDGKVTLMIRLSQPLSVPFQVIVNTMNVTAVGMCIYW